MRDDLRRPITILDGLVLIAATGIGIAGARKMRASQGLPSIWVGLDVVNGSVPFMLALTLGLLALGLRGPRPPRRKLGARPGWVACLVVGIALGIDAGLHLMNRGVAAAFLPSGGLGVSGELDLLLTNTIWRMTSVGTHAVAAAWAVMALLGCWRPRRDWVDRLGLILGVYWLALMPLQVVASFLPDILAAVKRWVDL